MHTKGSLCLPSVFLTHAAPMEGENSLLPLWADFTECCWDLEFGCGRQVCLERLMPSTVCLLLCSRAQFQCQGETCALPMRPVQLWLFGSHLALISEDCLELCPQPLFRSITGATLPSLAACLLLLCRSPRRILPRRERCPP